MPFYLNQGLVLMLTVDIYKELPYIGEHGNSGHRAIYKDLVLS